jgi:hypothetical protein
LRETVRGDVSGGLRSLAIAAGFSLTAAGFLTGRAAGIFRRADPKQTRLMAASGPAVPVEPVEPADVPERAAAGGTSR